MNMSRRYITLRYCTVYCGHSILKVTYVLIDKRLRGYIKDTVPTYGHKSKICFIIAVC